MKSSRRRLRSLVAGLGLAAGLAVAVIVPAGYAVVSYRQLGYELSFLAELKASRLARHIYTHRELWEYQHHRLAEFIEVPEATEIATQQIVFDAKGQLLVDTGQPPRRPVVRASKPIVVAGETVGRVETAASLREHVLETALIGLFSALLGFAIFFVIRILPLRVIDRTVSDLEATEARYRLLFDANPFPMVVVHRNTLRLMAVNFAAIEHYGYTREEFLGMTIADLRPADAPIPQRMRELAKKPTGGAATFTGQRHRKKDGSIIEVDITTRAITFDGQPAALSLAVDVTERNRAERARHSAEEQLRQSQKMESVGQLTGGIAHDFNNILTVIIANIEALEEADDLGSASKERLEDVGGAVERAAELTRQLLAFSRKQPLRPQVTDINDLVGGTTKLLRRSLGARVEIATAMAGDLWQVSVDRPQLETALVNLCVNARDAMPNGGKLTIETRNVVLDEDYAALNPDAAPGDYALLSVSDSGSGMSGEVLRKVFDPFFTTKEAGKGTGLGLSMVYGFIRQSNGHIKVYSELGRGTTFKLYLPRSLEAAEPAAASPPPPPPRGSERVLVVEDEPGVRLNAVRQLASLGYEVEEAPDGAAGLAAFEKAVKPYDLLLTDVVMPGPMDGKALADAVERRWPTTRIVFMSGYAESAIVHHGTIDEGVLLLSKPFRKVELASFVRQALDA